MVVAEVIVVCFEKFFLWRYVRFFTRKIIIDIKIGMNLMEIIKLREWGYFNIKWYKRGGTYLKSLIKKIGKLRKLNLSDRILSN